MPITRFRYAWEPSVYHSADGGSSGGGGNPPGDGQQGGDGGGNAQGDGKGGDEGKGGEGDPAKPEAKFTQSDLDRVVAQRLTEEKDRQKKRDEETRRKAETEAHQKNGEWEKVAKSIEAQKDTEIADLSRQIEELKAQAADRELSLIRERLGAKYQIPAQLVPRLRGEDEAGIEADCKVMVKVLGTREAPNPETGRGAGANGGGMTAAQQQTQVRKELIGKINYTPI